MRPLKLLCNGSTRPTYSGSAEGSEVIFARVRRLFSPATGSLWVSAGVLVLFVAIVCDITVRILKFPRFVNRKCAFTIESPVRRVHAGRH